MSRAGWSFLAVVAVTAVAAHVATLYAAPRALMAVAFSRLAAGDQVLNQMQFAPRVGPESRAVVRPAPDMAYAACVFDLGAGPVALRIARAGQYQSLSVYADNTDNVFTLSDREMGPDGAEVVLYRAGTSAPAVAAGAILVASPSRRGVVLDRRLAPTAAAFEALDPVRRLSQCGPLRPPG
jgi:uncharacterized membrane protein